MRRSALALALVGMLTLAGCSGEGSKDSSSPASTAAASSIPVKDAKSTSIDAVKVTGSVGKAPKVTFAAPLVVKKAGSKVVVKGKGRRIAPGEQITAHIVQVSGTDGSVLQSTYKNKQTSEFPLDKRQIAEVLYEAVQGQRTGSRILVTMNGAAAPGSAQQTLVYVLDLVNAKKIAPALQRATGEKVAPGKGLPTVKLAENGKPSITVPKSAPPKKLVAQPLIKGKGAKVKAGQTVKVHYTGVLWSNGKQFDSSWDRGEPYSVQNVGQAQVIAGWNEGLVGQTVGSQVLLVVPPDKGYGAQANNSIPANSTLVFVVDILQAV